MLIKYNLASTSGNGVTLPSGTGATSNASVSPLFFPRAGNLAYNSSSQSSDVGYYGRIWSSTIASTSDSGSLRAYRLHFTDTSVDPSNRNDRYVAFSVRCLVK